MISRARAAWAVRRPSGATLLGAVVTVVLAVILVVDALPSSRSAPPAPHHTAPPPPGLASARLTGVSCASSTSCVAVGETLRPTQRAVVARWDGARWATAFAPEPRAAQESELAAVSCSRGSCLAVGAWTTGQGGTGGGSVEHSAAVSFDGGPWSAADPPGDVPLTGVSCASASWCLAVGAAAGVAAPWTAEAWDGRSWTRLRPFTRAPRPPAAVSCPEVADCVAVQGAPSGGAPPAQPLPGLVAHLDHDRWTIEPFSSPAGATTILDAVACPSISGCAIVGGDQVLNRKGGSFSASLQASGVAEVLGSGPGRLALPLPASTLTGIACNGLSACMAVGVLPVVTRRVESSRPVAVVFDGRRWRATPISQPRSSGGARETSELGAVSCAYLSWCMAVGGSASGPLAAVWSQGSWREVPVGR